MTKQFSLAFCFILFLNLAATGQTTTFDNLNANPNSGKAITWTTSSYGNGFGHRLINSDPGGQTLLTFQGRHNSLSWTDIMSLTSNGKVGIGTLNPLSHLHISGGTSNDAIFTIEADTDNNNENDNPRIKFSQDGGLTNGFVGLNGDANQDFTNSTVNSLFIKSPGNFDFQIATNNIARVTVDKDGNTGIGTNTPSALLDVSKTSSFSEPLLNLNYPWDKSDLIKINRGSSKMVTIGNGGGTYTHGTVELFSSNESKIKISASPLVHSYFSGGNLGIGTSSPEYKLHVSSGVKLRKTTIGVTQASAENSWIRDDWLTGSYGAPVWNQSTAKWVRPSGTYNDIGSVVYQDEGTYFIRDKAGTQLEYTNSEFLGQAYMFAHIITGNVGIGTTTPDSKLTVKGKVHAEEVKVDLSVPGPDYVFANDYELTPLEQLQQYIQTNKHLPNIPSAKEMEVNGVELGVMNMKLLEKIEELTLYTLKQQQQINKLLQTVEELIADK